MLLSNYKEFINHVTNAKSIMINEKFDKTIKNFCFQPIFMNGEYDLQIHEKFNKSRIIVVDKYSHDKESYFIVCLERELMIIQICHEQIDELIHSKKFKEKVYFVNHENDDFNDIRSNFLIQFQMKRAKPLITAFWKTIQKCLATFFIKKSYIETYKDRKTNDENIEVKEFFIEEFVELKKLKGLIYLYYHIESEKIFAIKKFSEINEESQKLFNREYSNYKAINYVHLPKFYGCIKNEKSLIIEFINGETLNNNKRDELNINQKISIIFEILFTFWYLHRNNFIYRDLKIDNLMLDHNNHIVLIDFDRMINVNNDIASTFDLNSPFLAPEHGQSCSVSFKNDIFSIGKMIEFIFNNDEVIKDSNFTDIISKCLDQNPDNRPTISVLFNYFSLYIMNSNLISISQNDEFNLVNSLLFFIKENDAEAQNILGSIYYEGKYIKKDINLAIYYYQLAAEQNHSDAQYKLGYLYYLDENINKALSYFTLAAKQNNVNAQCFLGSIYHEGKYVKKDINRSIYYYTQAAKQNNTLAQNNLGNIYLLLPYITKDIINKAIYYFSLAAENNCHEAQYNLATIYIDGKYIKRDIKKSIHYFQLVANQENSYQANAQYNRAAIYLSSKFLMRDLNKGIDYLTLAANKNHLKAQLDLGLLYYKKKYFRQDIKKSIYYLTLAANQNNSEAQFYLGAIYSHDKNSIKQSIYYYTLAANQNHSMAQYNLASIYLNCQYIKRDIEKAIYYYTLAAQQYNTLAINNLAFIYIDGTYTVRDIDKSIYYFTLAANLNNSGAQNNLGYIYYVGKYVKQDIKKAIHYFTLSANQNNSNGQFFLGFIYNNGNKYIKRDINKSIHYYTLAANQNHPDAQYDLGLIYSNNKYKQDMNKAIYYYTLATNQNHSEAQCKLGLHYINGISVKKNINRAINYFYLSANQNNIYSEFILGVIYFEGKFIKRDINNAIKYFKKASSFNHAHAKNNLAIIYKNAIETTVNLFYAIELFNEAVKLNDSVSMYNLAHLYFYEENYDYHYDEIIKNLVNSSFNFFPSKLLLAIVLTKKYKSISLELIQKIIKKDEQNYKIDQLIYNIHEIIKEIDTSNMYEQMYNTFKTIDFMYDYNCNINQTSLLIETKKNRNNYMQKNIDKNFYEGFDIE